MFQRLFSEKPARSFFLFGPRGVGKSTWLRQTFNEEDALWINLLSVKDELELARDPDRLLERWKSLKKRPDWIVIDEVQKVPQLLDVVHRGIEDFKIKFALTGSSARKLRRGSSNLLAGRATEFHLFPFSGFELGASFDLHEALQWGTLPALFSSEFEASKEKARFLYSYISTYLNEEIAAEQLVRRLDPFRRFLPSAAQANGKILNFSSIGRDAGVDYKQVGRYFEILFDTMVAFPLDPFERSIRKRQTQKAKLYFFDPGIVRALNNRAEIPIQPGNYEYGDLFEHFVILEFHRLNSYLEKRFRFSYLRTKDDLEVDLLVERPRGKPLLIEIKSSDRIDRIKLSGVRGIAKDISHGTFYWLSRAKEEVELDGIRCVHWQQGLREIFDLA